MRNSRSIQILGGAAAVAVLPLFVTSNYQLAILTFIAINTIVVVGLNLLMGFAGQISLGHAAFFGLGAYTSAVLTTRYQLSPWLGILAGIGLTSAVAFLVGLPCLRLKGHYLAMATLGVGWIANIVMTHWEPVTLGSSGIQSIPKLAIGAFQFTSDKSHFYLAWVAALVVLAISLNLVDSRVGRAIRALHGSERAASTLGVDVARMKVAVFVVSAAFASLAGSLYAHTVNFISPSAFGFLLSVEIVVMAVIGGMASVWGAVLGAGAITLLVEWLRAVGQAVPSLQNLEMVAHGAILMLVMLVLPAGLVSGIGRLLTRRQRGRWRADDPATGP